MQNRISIKSCCLFIESLLNPSTGLAVNSTGDLDTTIYKNALAAFVLIHEGKLKYAEKMFNRFHTFYYRNKENFQGLPQKWNAETGMPDMTSIHWEGGAAFLLLALNYYKSVVKSFGEYEEFVQGLVRWLTQRTYSCDLIVAEAVAEMYAALSPFSKQSSIQRSLSRLHQCFFSTGQISSKDYEHNLTHIVRGLLVFGDTRGFNYLNKFIRYETVNFQKSKTIQAYCAQANDSYLNIEASAQLLLAWQLWQGELQRNLVELHATLEKLLIPTPDGTRASGLPFFLTGDGNEQAGIKPSLEPTCYWLFCKWKFNPFAPGKTSAL
ncbi:MAG: hypothetical protein ACE5HS_12615 [bacterium]